MPVTSVRLDDDLHQRLERLAEREQRTRGWLINEALRGYLEQEELLAERYRRSLEALEEIEAGAPTADGDAVREWGGFVGVRRRRGRRHDLTSGEAALRPARCRRLARSGNPSVKDIRVYTYVPSPVGELLVAGDGESLHRIGFPAGRRVEEEAPGPVVAARRRGVRRGPAPARRVVPRRAPDVRPAARRTRHRLPEAGLGASSRDPLRGDPARTASLAERLGSPSATRAVGAANGRNPLPIVLPCHRVIGADGSLTGFGGGLEIKRRLLEMEASRVGGRWRPADTDLIETASAGDTLLSGPLGAIHPGIGHRQQLVERARVIRGVPVRTDAQERAGSPRSRSR